MGRNCEKNQVLLIFLCLASRIRRCEILYSQWLESKYWALPSQLVCRNSISSSEQSYVFPFWQQSWSLVWCWRDAMKRYTVIQHTLSLENLPPNLSPVKVEVSSTREALWPLELPIFISPITICLHHQLLQDRATGKGRLWKAWSALLSLAWTLNIMEKMRQKKTQTQTVIAVMTK